jgi:hypothetical protein
MGLLATSVFGTGTDFDRCRSFARKSKARLNQESMPLLTPSAVPFKVRCPPLRAVSPLVLTRIKDFSWSTFLLWQSAPLPHWRARRQKSPCFPGRPICIIPLVCDGPLISAARPTFLRPRQLRPWRREQAAILGLRHVARSWLTDMVR